MNAASSPLRFMFTWPGPDHGIGITPEQMQPHDEENGRHEVVPPAAHVAHHPPRRRRDRSDRRDGNQNAHREQRRDRRLARAVLTRPWPLMKPTISGMLARWHGLRMMLRMPQTADAPKRHQRRAFHGVTEAGKELLHGYRWRLVIDSLAVSPVRRSQINRRR